MARMASGTNVLNGHDWMATASQWAAAWESGTIACRLAQLTKLSANLETITRCWTEFCATLQRRSASLRPAEVRMLRYLMAETGSLLAHLANLDGKAIGCTCHNDRAAV